MFEIIGKFTVFFVITFTLFIQYSLMCAGVVRKDISKFQNFMGLHSEIYNRFYSVA